MIIPSLKTFYENIGLLEISIKILRQYIIDKEDYLGKKSKDINETFYSLTKRWDKIMMVIKVTEGDFRPLALSSPKIAFIQLLLIAIRNFPYLLNYNPLRDKRNKPVLKAGADNFYVF